MLKIVFLFLMAGGLPVAMAMAGASLAYILMSGNLPPFVVIHRMVSGIDSFPLLAVPFFILAGNLMNNAGITNRIYNFALALGFFWLLGLCVFYQFFTRYVMNDSAAWTEEIARYLLICTVFMGVAAAVRRTRHIHVDFLYRLIPAAAGRALSTVVDIGRIVFFIIAFSLTVQMMMRMSALKMTIIDLPMNLVYGVAGIGFAIMFLRSIWVMSVHLRRGYTVLERVESTMEDRA